jgi:hypothetical protein
MRAGSCGYPGPTGAAIGTANTEHEKGKRDQNQADPNEDEYHSRIFFDPLKRPGYIEERDESADRRAG